MDPDDPLGLPTEADRIIDQVLAELERATP